MENSRNIEGWRRAFMWPMRVPAVLFAAVLAGTLTVIPKDAEAVPSFARQTGQSCAACHTHAPRLTQFGREFKISGYRMTARPLLANANIIEHMPIGGRLRGDVNYNSEDDDSVTVGVADGSRFYVSGRLTEYMGLHVNIGDSSGTDTQVTLANEFGDWTLGLTGGNVGFGRADPYDTIGRGAGYQLQRSLITEYDRNDFRGGALRNRGTGGLAYIYGHNIYLGAGAFDTSGDEGELRDFGVRFAYETPFADSHIGAFWFSAAEQQYRSRTADEATDEGTRMGIDAAAQWEITDEWSADVMGAYLIGEQKIRGDVGAAGGLENYDIDHRGWFVSATFLRGNWAYGTTFGRYNYRDDYSRGEDDLVESGRVTSINPNVSWLFAPNARLGFDVEFRDDDFDDFDGTIARIRYDIGF
ncbi:hypothetical protein M0534_13635 [Methylonatrum kenyense]|uniref:hypothetical protein n=1 Tax=Methylonatrum kenyense TaxID=455253 RepID=UPI0020BEEA25|nr:hypothetical protein [Methylonatrum kenyense]MCK8517358.1 hypothetical protein [Methylonatrum kenyense]